MIITLHDISTTHVIIVKGEKINMGGTRIYRKGHEVVETPCNIFIINFPFTMCTKIYPYQNIIEESTFLSIMDG